VTWWIAEWLDQHCPIAFAELAGKGVDAAPSWLAVRLNEGLTEASEVRWTEPMVRIALARAVESRAVIVADKAEVARRDAEAAAGARREWADRVLGRWRVLKAAAAGVDGAVEAAGAAARVEEGNLLELELLDAYVGLVEEGVASRKADRLREEAHIRAPEEDVRAEERARTEGDAEECAAAEVPGLVAELRRLVEEARDLLTGRPTRTPGGWVRQAPWISFEVALRRCEGLSVGPDGDAAAWCERARSALATLAEGRPGTAPRDGEDTDRARHRPTVPNEQRHPQEGHEPRQHSRGEVQPAPASSGASSHGVGRRRTGAAACRLRHEPRTTSPHAYPPYATADPTTAPTASPTGLDHQAARRTSPRAGGRPQAAAILPTDRWYPPLMNTAIRGEDLTSGLRMAARMAGRVSSPAEWWFAAGKLTIEWAGATLEFSGVGEGDGHISVRPSDMRDLARVPLLKGDLDVRYDDGRIHLGTFSFLAARGDPPKEPPPPVPQIVGPNPSTVDLLLLQYRHPEETIAAAGLTAAVADARRQRTERTQRAINALRPLGVAEEAIEALVDDALAHLAGPRPPRPTPSPEVIVVDGQSDQVRLFGRPRR